MRRGPRRPTRRRRGEVARQLDSMRIRASASSTARIDRRSLASEIDTSSCSRRVSATPSASAAPPTSSRRSRCRSLSSAMWLWAIAATRAARDSMSASAEMRGSSSGRQLQLVEFQLDTFDPSLEQRSSFSEAGEFGCGLLAQAPSIVSARRDLLAPLVQRFPCSLAGSFFTFEVGKSLAKLGDSLGPRFVCLGQRCRSHLQAFDVPTRPQRGRGRPGRAPRCGRRYAPRALRRRRMRCVRPVRAASRSRFAAVRRLSVRDRSRSAISSSTRAASRAAKPVPSGCATWIPDAAITSPSGVTARRCGISLDHAPRRLPSGCVHDITEQGFGHGLVGVGPENDRQERRDRVRPPPPRAGTPAARGRADKRHATEPFRLRGRPSRSWMRIADRRRGTRLPTRRAPDRRRRQPQEVHQAMQRPHRSLRHDVLSSTRAAGSPMPAIAASWASIRASPAAIARSTSECS